MSCVKIIMVGGRSGVGKTTLINSLLKYSPELYERPKSFTSRKRKAYLNTILLLENAWSR